MICPPIDFNQRNDFTTEPIVVSTRPLHKFLRVLVVDDEYLRNKSNAKMIESLGHKVEVSLSGIEALRIAAVNRPDVVLLNINLQDIDQCNVARHLRADYPNPSPLIIGFSPHPNDSIRQQSVRDGIDMVLKSPLNRELTETILLMEVKKLTKAGK